MLKLFRRRASTTPVTVLSIYRFKHGTTKLVRTARGHVEWRCDCAVYRASGSRNVPGWCKHISKAEARRSIERLLTMRVARTVSRQ